ncbi:hypothetical protein WA026_010496 [Henosepilachna vigintioctopunctata]|uniref:Knr4/Smi1-like domain-containing protein n=1 Tax=Henosepilachna vigintioctopunctata TaxID=420089 RepID=A0AAW1VBP3_9CUCU
MEFVVDKVSEDSFYENLLLGMPKILDEFSNISEPYLNRASPVQHNVICAWEQKNSVLLPEDLRSFYGSTDGIIYSFKYHLREGCDDDTIEAKIEVNSIDNLNQIYGYEINSNPGVNMDGDRYILRLGAESKVFELADLDNLGKVVLVYINSRYFPNIWVQTMKPEFFFLSDDFTTYLRMSIHHLGIPMWQFAYTEYGIPDSSKMLFRLMVPGLLPLEGKIEQMRKQYEMIQDEDKTGHPVNKLDLGIFRAYFRVPAPNTSSIIEQADCSSHSKKKSISKSRPLTTVVKKAYFKK